MKRIKVYTLEELKTRHPEAYESVHERWKESVAKDSSPAWSEETMDSLKAVIDAFGGTIRRYSIGAYANNTYLSVDVQDEWEEIVTDHDDDAEVEYVTRQKDLTWAIDEIIEPLGYPISNVGRRYPKFDGYCKLTGYCADDDLLQAVCEALDKGETLTEALEGLASNVCKMMENDIEQQQEEESMMANWGENQYTKDGTEV